MQDLNVNLLKSRATLPMIRRQVQPTARLLEASALLEVLLHAVKPVGYSGRKVEGMAALLRSRKAFFGSIDELLEANEIRNFYVHGGERGRIPSLAEAEGAAAVMVKGVEALLPHLPAAAAERVEYDPHEAIPAPTTAEALSLASPATQVFALHLRVESLLCGLDERGCQPGYDLGPGQQGATVRQRFDRHARVIAAELHDDLRSAFRWVAQHQSKEVTAAFEEHHRNRLNQIETVLLRAIGGLEKALGVAPEPVVAAVAMEVVVEEAVESEAVVPVVAMAKVAEEVEELAGVGEDEEPGTVIPAVAAAGAEVGAEPDAAGWRLRIRVPARTVRLAVRLVVATAATAVFAMVWSVPGRPSLAAGRVAGGGEGQGEVVLTLDERGEVTGIDVPQVLGCRLDANAIAAVSEWRFSAVARRVRASLSCEAAHR